MLFKTKTTVDYMTRINTEFMKLGLRGVSIFVASGDSGCWGRSDNLTRFSAGFPASSPYVTAVGGTYFKSNSIGEEYGTDWSGGK